MGRKARHGGSSRERHREKGRRKRRRRRVKERTDAGEPDPESTQATQGQWHGQTGHRAVSMGSRQREGR